MDRVLLKLPHSLEDCKSIVCDDCYFKGIMQGDYCIIKQTWIRKVETWTRDNSMVVENIKRLGISFPEFDSPNKWYLALIDILLEHVGDEIRDTVKEIL